MNDLPENLRKPGSLRREASRWGLAAVVMAGAHIGLVAAVMAMAPDPEPQAAEPALEVDLTPFIVTTPEAVESETITEDKQAEPIVEDNTEVAEAEETEQEAAAEPDQTVEEQPEEVVKEEPDEPIQQDEPDVVQAEPDPIVTPPAEVALPKPVKKKPVVKPKPVERKIEKPAPKKLVEQQLRKPPAKAAPKSTESRKTTAAKAPSVSPAKWYSQVYAAIARRKPRGDGGSGRVSVSFVVSSSGAVVSARVARSSGNSSLDAKALGMVRGARVPAPPAGVTGSRFPFTIPVSFE